MLKTFPFFGVVPAILDEAGEELEGEAEGYLVSENIQLDRRRLISVCNGELCLYFNVGGPITSLDIGA